MAVSDQVIMRIPGIYPWAPILNTRAGSNHSLILSSTHSLICFWRTCLPAGRLADSGLTIAHSPFTIDDPLIHLPPRPSFFIASLFVRFRYTFLLPFYYLFFALSSLFTLIYWLRSEEKAKRRRTKYGLSKRQQEMSCNEKTL